MGNMYAALVQRVGSVDAACVQRAGSVHAACNPHNPHGPGPVFLPHSYCAVFLVANARIHIIFWTKHSFTLWIYNFQYIYKDEK